MAEDAITSDEIGRVGDAIEDEFDIVIGEWTKLGMDERVYLRELLRVRVERRLASGT
jgi:hypothetical protein